MESDDLSSSARPSLLGLPGELRNRIYRLVVVEDERIEMTPIDPYLVLDIKYKLPGIIHASRQLREEARSIYFGENSFAVHIIPRQLTTYLDRLKLLDLKNSANCQPICSMIWNIETIIPWLEAYHGGVQIKNPYER